MELTYSQKQRDIDSFRKELNHGDIVYYAERTDCEKGYYVQAAVFEEEFSNCFIVRPLYFFSDRTVNGIPEKEFDTPTKWKKLPKGWSYDSILVKVEIDKKLKQVELGLSLKYDNPEDVKRALQNGLFKFGADIDDCVFSEEVHKERGYRIVRTYDFGLDKYPDSISINKRKLYKTYKEVMDVIDENYEEMQRIANLSDYDWSVEQIDTVLNQWCKSMSKTDIEKEECRKFILSQDNVEDIELRVFVGNLEWKYCKNKRWNTINLEVI